MFIRRCFSCHTKDFINDGALYIYKYIIDEQTSTDLELSNKTVTSVSVSSHVVQSELTESDLKEVLPAEKD